MTMKWMLLAPVATVLAIPAVAQEQTPRQAIEAAMADSAAGWNAGDIDRFLAIYSDDPATSFVGSAGLKRGKAGIRAQYLKSYTGQFGPESSAATRSVLSFTFDDFRLIGADHALLIARWTLTGGDGKVQTGMTSLIFRKEAGGWRIIADHSS